MSEAFKINLRRLRIAAGYQKASDLAEALNMRYTSYMNYENRGREPSYNELCRIAQKLHTTPNELLGFNEPSAQDMALQQWAMFGYRPYTDEQDRPVMSDDLVVYPIDYNSPDFPLITREIMEDAAFIHRIGNIFVQACDEKRAERAVEKYKK